jgi:hypothetical protein
MHYSRRILSYFAVITLTIFGFQVGNISTSPAVHASAPPGPGVCDGTKYNVSGWMWSSGAGWISLNCSNSPGTSGRDFGINQDPQGFWTGWAWSDYMGWLDMADTDHSGCPQDSAGYLPVGSSTPEVACRTKIRKSGTTWNNAELTGYARIYGGSTYGGLYDSTVVGGGKGAGWISWNCRNDHNFLVPGVQVENHCTTGTSTYGPKLGTVTLGTAEALTGFGWGGLNWGWIDVSRASVTIDPNILDLTLTPNASTVSTPYNVTLTWKTTTTPYGFSPAKCTAEARDVTSGSPVAITAAGWTGNANLLPPSVAPAAEQSQTTTVPAQKVEYRITCTRASDNSPVYSNWAPVQRHVIPVTLETACYSNDETNPTGKATWQYTGTASSCKLFKDGVVYASNLGLNDSKAPITDSGTFEVRCYDASGTQVATSNADTLDVPSCAIPVERCDETTPYATDADCYCINHGTDPLCTTTVVGVSPAACNIPATNPLSQKITWQAGGGTATTCRVFKGATRIATNLGLSGTQSPLSNGVYSVKCYASNASPDTPALAVSSNVTVNTTACVTCTADTTYTENRACFCGQHPTDDKCVPVPPTTTPTKPGVTEDKTK